MTLLSIPCMSECTKMYMVDLNFDSWRVPTLQGALFRYRAVPFRFSRSIGNHR
jgi:hypothetical protein